MLVIDKDFQTVNIYATLQEMQCIKTTKYLLQLSNDLTKEVFTTVVTDRSPNPDRYQQFEISLVTGSANPLNSELNLSNQGFYQYTFYQLYPDDIVTGSTGLRAVEFGKALVTKTEVTASAYQSSVAPKYYAYKKNS